MAGYNHKPLPDDVPQHFNIDTIKTIQRIVEHHNVNGVLYLRNDKAEMYTLPEITAQSLCAKLPALNRAMHRAVTEITDSLNNVNPVVDRIMDDDSVGGVVMTNRDGSPILTNVSLTNATNYGLYLHPFALMVQNSIKEMDPFNDAIMVRLSTKNKIEIMMVPDPEFHLVVIQHSREKHKTKSTRDKNNNQKYIK